MTDFLHDAPRIGNTFRYVLLYAAMRASYRALRAYQLAGQGSSEGARVSIPQK